jgi:HTH-type transcriptional regulator/antitoxin HigA
MDIRPIRTEADYDWALAQVELYFNDQPVPGTPDADRFDVLSDLIEAYEAKHHPIPQSGLTGKGHQSALYRQKGA